MHPDNLETRKHFDLCHSIKVFTDTRYFGGFIGDDDSKRDWLLDSMSEWEKDIRNIRETVGKCSQESYSTVVCAIQSELIFL